MRRVGHKVWLPRRLRKIKGCSSAVRILEASGISGEEKQGRTKRDLTAEYRRNQQVGAPGDVAIMDLIEAQTSFVDTRNNKRDGKLLLKPVQTVINGVPLGRRYQSPFAVR
jgi:hypothetical protein